jgi:hypothetical protein
MTTFSAGNAFINQKLSITSQINGFRNSQQYTSTVSWQMTLYTDQTYGYFKIKHIEVFSAFLRNTMEQNHSEDKLIFAQLAKKFTPFIDCKVSLLCPLQDLILSRMNPLHILLSCSFNNKLMITSHLRPPSSDSCVTFSTRSNYLAK